MSAGRVVAIINSFNRLSVLQKGFPALCAALRECGRETAVVLYDAGSKDGTVDWMRERTKENADLPIHLVTPGAGDDTSFSAGINAACAAAAREFPDAEYYFLFETDNWLAGPSPLRQAIKFLESEPTMAGAGVTVRKHSGRKTGYGSKFPTTWQFVLGPQLTARLRLDEPNPSAWNETEGFKWSLCEVVYTSPLLVRRSAWEQSVGLDAAAFPFSDCDLDWAWRLRKLGWTLGVIQSDEVVHDNLETLSKWSETRVLHLHRARLRLVERHRGAKPWLIKPILWLRHCVEWAGLAMSRRDPEQKAGALKRRRRLMAGVMAGYEH